MNPEGKVDRWSTRTVLTKEESEEVKLAGNERKEMEVDEVIPGTRPLSNEANGGFTVCEVARSTCRSSVPKKKSHEDFKEEDADEIGFVPSAMNEPRGAVHWCDYRCSEKGRQENANCTNDDRRRR